MKRIISILLLCFIVLSFSACSNKQTNVPVETLENNIVQSSTDDTQSDENKNKLIFSKDAYEQSVQQADPKDLNWATYSSSPSDVDLARSELIEDTYFWFQTPGWNKYVFGNTCVLMDSPNLVMYTFGIQDADYKELTISQSVSVKDLVDWRENSSEEIKLNDRNFTFSSGKCYLNNMARNEKQYVMLTIDDTDLKGCLIGISEENAFHTINDMESLIKRMAESIVIVDEMGDIEETSAESDIVQP